ncbi:hypothetical protein [Verminephrobacter aporrectodeae]|uniref:hypothetical protein n=1 Tax=Verminephrobacter aporrectodeae TaxID=1110389 RepID=UPI0038B40055
MAASGSEAGPPPSRARSGHGLPLAQRRGFPRVVEITDARGCPTIGCRPPKTSRGARGRCQRRILDPAVKALIEKDGWMIQWGAAKAGRKVKAVRFTFMRNPQQSLQF